MEILPAFLKRVQWNQNFVPGGVEKFWILTDDNKSTIEIKENQQNFEIPGDTQTIEPSLPHLEDLRIGRNQIYNWVTNSDQHMFWKPFNQIEPFR